MGDKIYADGTPATGDADGSFTAVRSKDWRQYAETWRPVTHGKKLHHNPPAAKTHKEEEGMPWRRAGEALVMADRRKAAPEIWKKRLTQLAKQTCKGLKDICQVNYDYSSFSSILYDAYKIKEKRAEASSSGQASSRSQAAAAEGKASGDGAVAPLALDETGISTTQGLGATKARRETRAEQRAREKREQEERYLAILDAALKFDIPTVRKLMQLKEIDNTDKTVEGI